MNDADVSALLFPGVSTELYVLAPAEVRITVNDGLRRIAMIVQATLRVRRSARWKCSQ